VLSKDRLINTFIDFVKISSLSLREKEFSSFLKNRLENLGLKVIEDNAGKTLGGNSGNLYAYLDGDGEPILISAHMDTVSPGENINPQIAGDYILSDGNTILGADDKAAISAIVEAIQTIKEKKERTKKIEFLFTIGEEIGLVGAKNIDPSLIKSKEGYVLDGEGDVGTLILRAPTHDRFYLNIYGKASHAGTSPEKGINAILLASDFLLNLSWGRIDDFTTANVGIIKGGRATNIVPDEVYLEGEFRSLDEDNLSSLWRRFEDNLIKLVKKGASYDLRKETLYRGFNIDEREKVVRRIVDVLNQMEKKINLTYTMGGSDANILNSYGIKTVNVGIGMENAHSKEERIKIENLYDTAVLIYNLIRG
jgi:tripeptide aminopeptidase